MNESANNEPSNELAKELFDDSVERLDAATLSRLNQGRQRALEEVAQPGSTVRWWRWLPATGFAAAAVLAVMVMRAPAGVDSVDEVVSTSDFEMLLETDSLEMIEELEFYSLLDQVDIEAPDNVG